MRNQWFAPLAWVITDGTAVANTTTETIIFPNVNIAANYMHGERCLHLRASGKLSTTGTPTITFAIRWGGVAGTLLANSEPITNGSGVTNVAWWLEADIQTRSNGSTGTLLVMGSVSVHTAAATVVVSALTVSGHDAPAAVSVDLTAATDLSLTADWSAASASNTLTGMMYRLDSIN